MKLNARVPLKEIGKKLNVDLTLVDYRIKKMISEKLINYFSIEIDSSKLGYEQYLLFLNLRGSEEDKDKLVEDLKNMKEAFHYYEYLNYWEIVVTFCVKNMEEMNNVFLRLQDKYKDVIKDHEILGMLKKYKKEPYPDVERVYRKI